MIVVMMGEAVVKEIGIRNDVGSFANILPVGCLHLAPFRRSVKASKNL